MKNPNVTEGNLLSNKMEVNLNMLRPLMLHWIAGEVYSTDVVTVDQGGTERWVAKLKKQLTQPSGFSNTIRHSTIFSFSARFGDSVLTLGGPGHQVVPEEHFIA
jgi:hypothetical protein